MRTDLEHSANPEILAHEMQIEWGINPERLTRLRGNLRKLFDEKMEQCSD